MERVSRSREDLENQLHEQIEFLLANVSSFDSGKPQFAKQIATNLRTLLYDGKGRTKSLLGQLKVLESKKFLNTAEVARTPGPNTIIPSHSALVGVSGNSFIPHFDDVPGGLRTSDFEDWWEEVVHRDHSGNTFTRKEMVTYLADQDGGAHVDAELDKKYRELSRENSLGWLTNDGTGWKPIERAEAMTVRQIAHELLRTLEVPYEPVKPVSTSSLTISGSGFTIHTIPTDEEGYPIRRKDPCPCGSGKKYKRCHGK